MNLPGYAASRPSTEIVMLIPVNPAPAGTGGWVGWETLLECQTRPRACRCQISVTPALASTACNCCRYSPAVNRTCDVVKQSLLVASCS